MPPPPVRTQKHAPLFERLTPILTILLLCAAALFAFALHIAAAPPRARTAARFLIYLVERARPPSASGQQVSQYKVLGIHTCPAPSESVRHERGDTRRSRRRNSASRRAAWCQKLSSKAEEGAHMIRHHHHCSSHCHEQLLRALAVAPSCAAPHHCRPSSPAGALEPRRPPPAQQECDGAKARSSTSRSAVVTASKLAALRLGLSLLKASWFSVTPVR